MLPRQSLVLALALIAAPPAHGQLRHYVDVRRIQQYPGLEERPAYYLMFAARKGIPGHAFVMWGIEDPVRQMSVVNAFGLYPSVSGLAVVPAVFAPVPGALRDEAMKMEYEGCCTWNNPDYLAVVRVDKSTFDQADKVRQDYNANISQYQMAEQDCVTFLMDVGTAAGFEMPSRLGLANAPAPYLDKFLRKFQTQDGGTITLDGQAYRVRGEPKGTGHEGWVGLRELGVGGNLSPSITARSSTMRPATEGFRARIETEQVFRNAFSRRVETFAEGDEWQKYLMAFGIPFDNSGVKPTDSRYRQTDGRVVQGALPPDQTDAPPVWLGKGWYAGDRQKGLPHGKGVWRAVDGSSYTGQFVDGRFEGKGVARFANGDVYTGSWSNNEPRGPGELAFARSGRTHVGTFDHGVSKDGYSYKTGGPRTQPSPPPTPSTGPPPPMGPLNIDPMNVPLPPTTNVGLPAPTSVGLPAPTVVPFTMP
jgi:hypothetical protein